MAPTVTEARDDDGLDRGGGRRSSTKKREGPMDSQEFGLHHWLAELDLTETGTGAGSVGVERIRSSIRDTILYSNGEERMNVSVGKRHTDLAPSELPDKQLRSVGTPFPVL